MKFKKYLVCTLFLSLFFVILGCDDNKYKVNYVFDGNVIDSRTVENGNLVEDIKYFIDGKVFKGYFLDVDLKTKLDLDTYKVSSDINIYLKYEKHRAYNFVYVPLDDRPVNVDRLQYLSKGLNINLIMPDVDLYRTHLDNQLLNSNGTQVGDPVRLLEFVKSQNKDEVDAFIISLDQMTSGGLVGSRADYDSDITLELQIVEELIEYVGDKPLYLLDTVMRLASTDGFKGYTATEYTNLRLYTMVDRLAIDKDDLTLENIIANYNISSDGKEIDYHSYGISDTQYENYMTARERKIRLTDRILSLVNKETTKYICGVDDSSNTYNIQMNEIKYIEKIYPEVYTFPGTDELGLMWLSRAYQDLTNYRPLKLKVTVFGDGYEVVDANYDGITMKENVENHINALGDVIVEEDFDLEILVLTASNNINLLNSESKKLVAKMKENIKNNIPTAILDGNSVNLDRRLILAGYLMKKNNLSSLMGYSSWNTVANTIGLGLSQATTRTSYLLSDYSLYEDGSTKGFVASLAFGFIKDLVYKTYVEEQIKIYINNNSLTSEGEHVSPSSNFYQYIPYSPDYIEKLTELMETYPQCNVGKFTSNFVGNNAYKSLRNGVITEEVSEVKVDNYSFPWYRIFEIRFDVSVSIK